MRFEKRHGGYHRVLDDRQQLVEVRRLGKQYYKPEHPNLVSNLLARRNFWALWDVDLVVKPGEVWGIMGVNGSGKSTLMSCIAGITQPSRGRVTSYGRPAMVSLGMPYHPEFSGAENIRFGSRLMGMKPCDARAKFTEMVTFAGLDGHIDKPFKRYSDGMKIRLYLTVALHSGARVVLLDDILTVTDSVFQRLCLATVRQLAAAGAAVLIASHVTGVIEAVCQHGLWLDAGMVRAQGPCAAVANSYRRYTGE